MNHSRMTEDYGLAYPVEHKCWTITYNRKPIPLRTDDYDAVHNDYDGLTDSRCFTAASLDDAIAEINWLENTNGRG